MTHESRAAFVLAGFGLAFFPMQTVGSFSASSDFQPVFYKECHMGCKPGTGTDRRHPCVQAQICHTETTIGGNKRNAPPQGGSGPTGSTGPTKPVPPKTSGAHY